LGVEYDLPGNAGVMLNPIFIHVPKTGGANIGTMLKKSRLQYKGHKRAVDVIKKIGQEAWDSGWTFAFIRNPWARAASYYLSRSLPKGVTFGDWCKYPKGLPYCFGDSERSPYSLLCDDGGHLVVSQIYRYEEYAEAISEIQTRLRVNFPMTYTNVSVKPDNFNYRDLYDDDCRQRVSQLSSWEIDEFGYEF